MISAPIFYFIAAGKIEKMAEITRENNLFESIMKFYTHNVKHYKKKRVGGPEILVLCPRVYSLANVLV